MPQESKPFFVKLPDRGLIQIKGDDRYNFLQGLISNDVETLKNTPVLYSCLLTPQGKFLYDFFIIAEPDGLLLDCEGGQRAQDLYKRLTLYRLRSKITLFLKDNHPVYAGTGTIPENAFPDPRHPDMGWRSFKQPNNIKEKTFSTWDAHRIRLGVPDGSRDMIPEKSTLLECNIDKLNGVSFAKGCYVGQEVTARMKYRGLAKKHLYPVRFTNHDFEPYNEIKLNGKTIGDMRSVCDAYGLALLKDDSIAQEDLPFTIVKT